MKMDLTSPYPYNVTKAIITAHEEWITITGGPKYKGRGWLPP